MAKEVIPKKKRRSSPRAEMRGCPVEDETEVLAVAVTDMFRFALFL
jgi:hypothetical protein